ncbi:MAG: SulP family inorganic anion transporter [Acidobacteriaceae bacterium]|nr:SulP family inorganic anion transporter [Acidobacteriaceae bacterium]
MLKKTKYSFRAFVGDCFGGIIAALIALPYGLAMASLMGLPPVFGIFTSIITAPIIALLGKNPLLIGGTGSATVPFIAFAAKQQGVGGAAKVCIVAAVFMMVFCVVHWGRFIQKVPPPVVSGFSCGIGAMMLISQMDTIFGLASPLTRSASSTLIQLWLVLQHLPQMKLAPLFIGVLVILGASLSARMSPRVPAPLIGVLLAIIASRLIGLHEVAVGNLPLSIPAFATFSWSPADVYTVLPSGFALAFVTSVNILITSRVVEHFRGRHQHMKEEDADAELGAYGIANICAGMFGAPMSVGIPARSLAAVRCGATTRIANVLHAVFLILFLFLGIGFVSQIPIPALAGVTAWMGICLLDWSYWRRLPRMRRVDATAFLATAIAVLMINAVAAVAIGSSPYILHYLWARRKRQPAQPHTDLTPTPETQTMLIQR